MVEAFQNLILGAGWLVAACLLALIVIDKRETKAQKLRRERHMKKLDNIARGVAEGQL